MNNKERYMNMKAVANYNMGFDNGTFVKGKAYDYRFEEVELDGPARKFFITTEERVEQELWDSEFNILFTIEGEE